MAEIPRSVLSEHFQHLLEGRRLRSAVFLTFRFEPDFFEQEVLPAVVDLSLSHVPQVRLLQLEDALKSEVGDVAVYYDRGGLAPGGQSARLDVRRVPVAWPSGYFHPKNVLLLTESREADDTDHRSQRLIVASMSANLTRAGWWENVEVCHTEDVGEGESCAFRSDLLDLIRRVRSAAPPETNHEAMDAVRAFVTRLGTPSQRSSKGILHPRLYCGRQSVPDFLEEILRDRASGTCLEVISPYFDQADAAPLRELQQRLSPRETRVFLPRGDDGSALCSDAVYDAISTMERTSWAQLPPDLLRAGKAEQVKRRTVHAKVYRFFDPRRGYEALFVGSVNLTRPAHDRGGNFETGFLVETEPQRGAGWWLTIDTKRPVQFETGTTDDPSVVSTPLLIRFAWEKHSAAACWDSDRAPGRLSISAQGVPLFTLETLPNRAWHPLPRGAAEALERVLASTSFLGVSEDGGPEATILVQEEAMAHKPSLLNTLSAAEILRYWALLTQEQRSAFLEERAEEIPEVLTQLGIGTRRLGMVESSMFDTFAGVYHGFGTLERFVLDALHAKRQKEAEYRLLGRKYDSLPSLLDRVLKDGTDGDPVTQYVIVLCARQLVRRVRREHPHFVDGHRGAFRSLERQITRGERIRDRFTFGTPEDRAEFLAWFDEWFLRRAEPMEVPA